MKTENALIENVTLNIHDHDCLTLAMTLKMNHTGVVFGSNICLATAAPEENLVHLEKGNYTGFFITKIFEVVGVSDWNELKGKPVRVLFKGNGGLGSKCIGIQNFLDDSEFFIPVAADLENETPSETL